MEHDQIAPASTSGPSLSNHKHWAHIVRSMPFDGEPLILTEEERQELDQMTQSRMLPSVDVILSLLVGESIREQQNHSRPCHANELAARGY